MRRGTGGANWIARDGSAEGFEFVAGRLRCGDFFADKSFLFSEWTA